MATDREVDVPDPDHPRIVVNDRFGGQPHLRGRRITVLDVYEQVREGIGDLSPAEFAERFDVPIADVYSALAYYHDHLEEMQRHRKARSEVSETLRDRIARERPSDVEPTGG